ncbi:hypothetical protein FACS1894103_5940 [Campylobacterota bacterium]|nr:hypothetical protein FACS1894103_5940 [Campylobacterota bacterium]
MTFEIGNPLDFEALVCGNATLVEGVAVKFVGFEEFRFALAKPLSKFQVFELSSGRFIAESDTQSDALIAACNILSTKGVEGIKAALAQFPSILHNETPSQQKGKDGE